VFQALAACRAVLAASPLVPGWSDVFLGVRRNAEKITTDFSLVQSRGVAVVRQRVHNLHGVPARATRLRLPGPNL